MVVGQVRRMLSTASVKAQAQFLLTRMNNVRVGGGMRKGMASEILIDCGKIKLASLNYSLTSERVNNMDIILILHNLVFQMHILTLLKVFSVTNHS